MPNNSDFREKARNEVFFHRNYDELAVLDNGSSSKPNEIEIDGVIFEIPLESSPWSLIPLQKIQNDDIDGITQTLFDLHKKYEIPYPENIDSIELELLKEYLINVVCNPKLKVISKNVQRDDDLRVKVGTPRESRPGIFCRVNYNGKISLNYIEIANYLHRIFHTITFHPSGLPYKIFIYNEDEGIYRENSGDLESVINRIYELSEAAGSITRDTKEILHLISSKNFHTTYPFNIQNDTSIGLIPVLNGVVKIDFDAGRVSLFPHSNKHLWTFTLPIIYNPMASSDDIIQIMKSWIGEWTDEEIEEGIVDGISRPDKWRMLIQIPAQGLLQYIMDKSYKTSYIIVGEPNAGKSSYLTHFLPHFFGSDAVAGESLHKIVNDKFVTAELENKILNVFDDLSDTELESIGQFKAITGITRHTINRKHKGGYIGRIYACHCFACNQPPKLPDSCLYDTAFWDRWIFIRFPYFHSKEPSFLQTLLTEENLSSFLILTLGMIVTIRKNHALPFQMSVEEVMQLWMQKADPLAVFFEEMLRKCEKVQSFDRELFFSAFRKWFDEQNPPIDPRKKILTLKDFAAALIRYEIISKKTSTKIENKKINITVFQGKYTWIYGQELMKPQIKGLDTYKDSDSR